MLIEAVVYAITTVAVGVFAFDALRTPCTNGHRSWRWKRSCQECVEHFARRFR